MNQILSTENVNNKNNRTKSSGSKDINSVIKFFAIIMLIFGLFLIINSSYAIVKENHVDKPKELVEPNIQIETKGEDKLLLKVMHEYEIEKVTYSWNNENPTTIEGNGTKFIQKELNIPNGENVLYVTATDVNGATKNYKETFELHATTDIEISISGNNIKINIDSQEEVSELKYAWDEEEQSTVEVNNTEYSMELEAPIGRHTLYVTTVDVNGEEEEKIQEVVGTTKPTVKLAQGDNAYAITASDEIGLDRIEITTLNDGKITKIQSDGKEFEYNFPLKEGDDNFIEVVAYNENGVASDKIRAKWPN